jgi:hypothetical protein
MCAGVRDAWNLAWKLALVAHGRARADLLDTYEAERRPHVDAVGSLSELLGALFVMPVARPLVLLRNAAMRLAHRIGPLHRFVNEHDIFRPLPRVEAGGLLAAGSRADAFVGAMFPYGRTPLSSTGVCPEDLVDGAQFVLLLLLLPVGRGAELPAAAVSQLAAARPSVLRVVLLRASEGCGSGVCGVRVVPCDLSCAGLPRWMAERGLQGMLVRPDHVIAGCYATVSAAVSSSEGLCAGLLDACAWTPGGACLARPRGLHRAVETTLYRVGLACARLLSYGLRAASWTYG